MATIKERIMQMEQRHTKVVKKRPIPFYVLPPEGDPARTGIQAEISKIELAETAFITYEIVE
jgi:hypothetical protein